MADWNDWVATDTLAPAQVQEPQSAGRPPLYVDIPGKTGATAQQAPARGPTASGDPLALIEHYESGGQNIPNYRYDRTHTAGGFWQITDTNWKSYAPNLGIDLDKYPNAMAAPKDVQRKVAQAMYDKDGYKPWAPYNPALASAIGQGWATTQNGKWNVSPSALAFAQNQPDSDVVWMSPDEYQSRVSGPGGSAKRSSLLRNLGLGQNIEEIPELELGPAKDGRAKITGYDGYNRAQVAKDEGVDLMPVRIRRVSRETPSFIEDMHGTVAPYNYTPVPKAEAPQQGAMAHILGGLGRGAADVALGAVRSTAGGAVPPEATMTMTPQQAAEISPERVQQIANEAAAQRNQDIASERAARGETGTDWWRTIGQIGATLPLAALVPTAGGAGAGAGVLSTLARAAPTVTMGALTGAPAAALPAYGAGAPAGEALREGAIGAALGGGVAAAPAVGSAARQAVGAAAERVVSPRTVTQAVSRLLGEDTKKLTSEVLQGVRSRTGDTLERIENAHPLDLSKDTTGLVDKVRNVRREAALLGDEGNRVVNAANEIFDRFLRHDTILPGGDAAKLWHRGSPLDRLTLDANSNVSRLANDLEGAVRDAFHAQLPPDVSAEYGAARGTWRDLKIATKAVRGHEIRPNLLQTAVGARGRFPEFRGTTGGPAIAQLARAVDALWPPSERGLAGSIAGHIARGGVGAGIGTAVGGPIGGAVGFGLGDYIFNRLAQLRIPGANNLTALRPPIPASAARPPSMMGNALSGIGQIVPRLAPAAASAIAGP